MRTGLTMRRRTRLVLKGVGYAAGIVLLVGALWAAFSQDDGRVAEVLHTTHPAMLSLLAVLAIASAATVAASFWVGTSAYGRVGFDEMLGLVGLAWLLNYLPMRPGLVGRVAYHKRYNRISVRDSARVLAINGVATLTCSVHVGVASLLSVTDASVVLQGLAWVVPALVQVGVAWVLGGRGPARAIAPWRLVATVVLHYVDVGVWTARYAVASQILGEPISMPQAGALAALSQFAFLVPFAGNGLGVREWSLGLAGMAGLLGAGEAGLMLGVQIELVNRAAEAAASLPAGLFGALVVYRRRRSAARVSEMQSRTASDPTDAADVQIHGTQIGVRPAAGGDDGQQDRAGPPAVPPDRAGQDPQGSAEVPHA